MLRVWLVILLTVLALPASAEPPLSLELQPAWAGISKANHDTEVHIRLLARHGGAIEIRVPGQRPAVHWRTRIDAQVSRTIAVPVRPGGNAPLRIEAQLDDSTPVTATAHLVEHPGDSILVAVATRDTATPPGKQGARVIHFTAPADVLPRTAAGYSPIDRLIIDPVTIASLDKAQLAALSGFARRCGAITIVEAEARWFPRLQAVAGCSARFVARAPTLVTAQESSVAAERLAPPALPAASALAALLADGDSRQTWRNLALFFSCYVIGLLLLGRHIRKARYLFLLPVGAALLALLAWSNDNAQRQLATWAEMNAHDSSLRFATLLRIQSRGRGQADTSLPAELGLLQSQSTQSTAQLHYQDGAARLVVDSYLLATQDFVTQGSAPAHAPFQLVMTTDGPLVSNPGATPTPPALLGWQGRRHPVPPLQPGEHWRPPADATPWQSTRAEERLLRGRTQTGPAALLTPFRLLPAAQHTNTVRETGWLLLRSS